jgi:NADH:ubiquinone oxidoreductase subunit 6 (subunit J)
VGLLFAVLLGLTVNAGWAVVEEPAAIDGAAAIAGLGAAFVGEYLIAFELLALLLLVALSGALLLARDRK